MAREFDALALKSHNYPIWAMNIKIAFVSHGLVRQTQTWWIYPRLEWRRWQMKKKGALYIIKHHIHPDLKVEYLEEESPST